MKRGTVVLFPFTDLTGRKVRPALVVSRSGRTGDDIILAFITTYRGQPLLLADLLVSDSHAGFGQTGLKAASVVKCDKLVTVRSSIVLGELGSLSPDLLEAADQNLRYALDV